LRSEAASLGIKVSVEDIPSKVGKPSEKVTGEIPDLKDYNFQGEPGGQSLEK